MSSIKKTIFLSNKQNNNIKSMATVTLEKKNQNIFGTIKTYNIDNKLNYILGIKQKEKIYKQNILLDNDKYNFIISNVDEFVDDIGCVLLTADNQKYTPIIWGSNTTINYKSQIINSLQQSINKIKSNEKKDIKNTQSLSNINLNESSIEHDFSPLPQSVHNTTTKQPEEINYNSTEEIITPYHNEVAIASSTASLFESDDLEIEKEIEKEMSSNTTHDFYEMIAEQLNELFDKYPRDHTLENLIDNSKWVKLKHDDNKYYVVGIIYNNNDIKYICYGVPGNYSKEPPTELKNYSQWLPTDITNPFDNGYWVMYQDADTGENILLN